MADLHVTSAGVLHDGEIVVELSDGRTLTFSVEKLLSLVPDSVATPEDVVDDSA